MPSQWQAMCFVLELRTAQKIQKMRLLESDATSLEDFLTTSTRNFRNLNNLQAHLPKTSIEILMSVYKRGVSLVEAELIADYLEKIVLEFQFQNVGGFEENTSHIIGRTGRRLTILTKE